MTRRAIVHIGTEKTGSTAIQSALAHARKELAQVGFRFARSPGNANHMALARYALADESSPARSGRRGQEAAEALPERLQAEMAELPARIGTVIFSSEHCHSRITDANQVRRIKALLDRHFDEYMIVVYLRRQDELAVSSHSEALKSRHCRTSILPEADDTDIGFYDYKALLDRWSSVFGRAAMLPRIFSRVDLPGGDVVRDFLEVCGLGEAGIVPQPVHTNPSLSAAAQAFMLRFNTVLPKRAALGRPRLLLQILERHAPGSGALPAREEARRFYRMFTTGNEAVRQEYFPDRATLFSDDFSRYPEQETQTSPAVTLRVARAVLRHLREAHVGDESDKSVDLATMRTVRRVTRQLARECKAT